MGQALERERVLGWELRDLGGGSIWEVFWCFWYETIWCHIWGFLLNMENVGCPYD